MFSNSQLVQQPMHLTIQPLPLLGITAQEGESVAAAYHCSVLQITELDNINAAREDYNKVMQLLEDCMVALGIQDTICENQIIENLYME